ncbi:restriction endonuclease [Streptomyces canus]|uniref:restriction endonuclease n=1 Tax=Streptomyces canus TaxID=58343 RepID=UPI0033C00504
MAGRQLEERVAQLLERDGFTSVEVTGAPGDLGADVTARTVGARQVVVQCMNYADRRVTSTELQRFGGTFRTVHAANVGLVVTTTDFNEQPSSTPSGPASGSWTGTISASGARAPPSPSTDRPSSQPGSPRARPERHVTAPAVGTDRWARPLYRSTVSLSSPSIS